jgi:periplasmic protein TonB
MNYPARLLVCAVVAVVGHLLLIRGAIHLPPRAEAARPMVVQVMLKTPPPPEPEKPAEPEATPETKTQPTHQAPARRRAMAEAPKREVLPRNPPPTERPATGTDTTTTPVFGISMESTSAAGTGPALPIGNTLQTRPTHTKVAAAEVKPLAAAPVQAYEVTKMPLPVGRCTGKYTEEARQAGLEGTVILDIVVGEDGVVRDIKIVEGLGQGLNEAAMRALKACRFTPGERDGKPVPVRVRRFKVHFALGEAE